MAFIARSTLYDAPGGDTIQLLETAKHLRKIGADVTVHLTTDKIPYEKFDLFHFSNLTRPSDILYHIDRIWQPFTLSPLLVDYSEYDRYYRKGLSGLMLRGVPTGMNEYIKTIARWVLGKDALQGKSYLWKGQEKSIRKILQKAAWILPNSETEYKTLQQRYGVDNNYTIVPNGVNTELFNAEEPITKDTSLVLCAARIEGIKNQLNLIRALNNTRFTLMIVGSPAPNQPRYYEACRKLAAGNIQFYSQVPQHVLTGYYKTAKVHVLPSWFETCGLSSLEAASMGCNIVITEKGYTRDYFGDDAFYCDPADPQSILSAVEQAAVQPFRKRLKEKIHYNYTWQQAAAITLNTCNKIIST